MRYLISAAGADLNAKVDKRFGHPAYHLLVDGETMEFEVYPGPGDNSPFQKAKRFLDFGIAGVIAGNVGPNAFRELNAQGIKVYICRGMTVREAVELVSSGWIEPATKSTMKVSVRGGGKGGGAGRGMGGGGRR